MTKLPSPPPDTPLSKRTDDEIRDRARELHEYVGVIEIPEGAQVVRPNDGDECARIEAWIYLGPTD